MRKKIWMVLLLVLLIPGLSGCASLRDKFTRKKKKDKEELPKFYAVREYDIKPSIELYTKHYIFWKNWNKEFLAQLGKNVKKDRQCLEHMIMHLKDMKIMLKPPLDEELQEHIDTLQSIQPTVYKGRMNIGTESRVRHLIEKEYSLVRTTFSYNKVGEYIASNFQGEYVETEDSPENIENADDKDIPENVEHVNYEKADQESEGEDSLLFIKEDKGV
ncbi:MAG: hypothetical protein PHQ52_02810 [Candidatus Omnitrophica bacterium]|nr:hypothetical protein [Candidatus Omnitrophota bacterium]